MADPPAQSHFHFDFLGSIATMYRLQPQQAEMWVSNNHTTYLLLRPGTDPAMDTPQALENMIRWQLRTSDAGPDGYR